MELLHNNNVIHETNVSTQLTKAISIDPRSMINVNVDVAVHVPEST